MCEDIDMELIGRNIHAFEILTDISKLPYREDMFSPVMYKHARTVLN